MKKNDALYLRHILDAIQDVHRYLEPLPSLESFCADDLRVNAVIRLLEVIGEASAHVSPSLRSMHSDVPWEQIIAMRNRLIHEYFGVDEELVWKVCKEELPILQGRLHTVLQKLLE